MQNALENQSSMYVFVNRSSSAASQMNVDNYFSLGLNRPPIIAMFIVLADQNPEAFHMQSAVSHTYARRGMRIGRVEQLLILKR